MARPIKKVLFIEPRAPRPHIFSRVVIPRLGSVLLGTILQNHGLDVKVVVDKRSGERRRIKQSIPLERRRADRRKLKEELVEVVISA